MIPLYVASYADLRTSFQPAPIASLTHDGVSSQADGLQTLATTHTCPSQTHSPAYLLLLDAAFAS
eukprot:1161765-Pelagomonas_calceolata.AAC.9